VRSLGYYTDMDKETEDYIDGWFARQRGETVAKTLRTPRYIKNWFATQRGEIVEPSDASDLFTYIQRRLKKINDKRI